MRIILKALIEFVPNAKIIKCLSPISLFFCQSQLVIYTIDSIYSKILVYLYASIFFISQNVVNLCLIPCVNRILPPSKNIKSSDDTKQEVNSLIKMITAFFQVTLIVQIATSNLGIWIFFSTSNQVINHKLDCFILGWDIYFGVPFV